MTIQITRSDLPNPVDPRDPTKPTLADVAPSDLVVKGRNGSIDVSDRVKNIALTRTIDGASTITATISDPDLTVLNSDAIKGNGDGNLFALATLDSLKFQLVGLNTRPREITLTFEDESIHRLRKDDEYKTSSRKQVTRAQFIKTLCDEAGVELFCPEIDLRQPIQSVQDAQTPAQRRRQRQSGLAPHATLTVKQATMTGAQRAEANRLLSVADSLHATELPTLSLIVAAIGESTMGANPGTYRPNRLGYWGVLQGGSGQHGSARNFPDPHDTEGMAHSFLKGGLGFQRGGAIALSRTVHDAGAIATAVEGSGEQPNFYGVYLDEAKKILAAYRGGDGSFTDDTSTFIKSYQFRRGESGKAETSWACMRRLADEVGWYIFCVAGTVYFMSPERLKRSEARMLVKPGAPGIIEVNADYDTSPKHDNTITVLCEAARWAAPPGSVAEVQGYGPLDQRWLVQDISRKTLTSTITTITLARFRRKALDEPAHEIGTSSGDTTGGVSALNAGPGDITFAAGANRTGHPLTDELMQFLRLTAGIYGHPLVVTRGTNHNRVSTSGLVSDHYAGNAADIGMAANHGTDNGPVGDAICAAALQVAGFSRGAAKAAAKNRGEAGFHGLAPNEIHHGGLRIQILWGFNIFLLGGDHTNHVHIGIKADT